MKILLFLLLLVSSAYAQGTGDVIRIGSGSSPTSWIIAAPPPMNSREYSLSILKEYAEFDPSEFSIYLASQSWYRGSPEFQEQMISFSVDGTPHLTNISTEDALLLLYSSEVKRSLDLLKEQKARRESLQKALKSVPPSRIKVHSKVFKLYNVPQWNSAVLGDTTCDLSRVRILETNEDKAATVLHEVMHVATECSRNKDLHNAIYVLAPSLLRILRDNPDLVAYLTKKEN